MTDKRNGLLPIADDYQLKMRLSEQGTVISVGDGIVWVEGLPSAMMDEVLYLEDGSSVLVFLLDPQWLGAIVLNQSQDPAVTQGLASGAAVVRSGKRLSIGVGDQLLARTLDPLGNPLDGQPEPVIEQQRPLENPSPDILDRDFVNQPLYTGNRMIDSLIPIGKGQRQLLIGDGGLGKTSLAIDAIIRQRSENVRCVYVAVGQTRSSVATVRDILEKHQALEYTTLIVAEANALCGLRYLAPFAGCAIAEHWMRQGQDTLIVYDDLNQHAQAYRELSLLLHRPPGREAYPGDIFYLHARLLERSTVLAPEKGGGSMTALPVIETKQGEISSYIPTNLISITDGQIYLDQKLFAAGILPAIDVTRSVSRIGGKAQSPAIKREAGRIRLDYLQFLELEVFTRFGTRLEADMAVKLQRGRILRKLLLQERLRPISSKAQLAWLIAYNDKLLDNDDIDRIPVLLETLQQQVDQSSLSLADNREQWLTQLQQWLKLA